jgi:hypothetical protein
MAESNNNGIVKVAGMWELGWNTPITEHDQWVYPLQEFKVDGWYMSPISGIAKSSLLEEVADIQEIIDLNPDLTVVWVDERGETPLQKFEHPPQALYIAGRTSESKLGMRKAGDLSVHVESVTNSGGFWAHQAVVMVLYDRMTKSWQ